MTKQIDIKELIPYLRYGYVAMEEDEMWVFEGSSCTSLNAFNIAPVEDWTKSLIKVENKDE